MDEYLLSKDELSKLLENNDYKELQNVYSLCLKDKIRAHNHQELVALMFIILSWKWGLFSKQNSKVDFFFNLKNFKDNKNDVLDLYRILRRTNHEILFTIIEEDDPIAENVKVEFLEMYASFLIVFFCQLKCISMCNCALIRQPNNSTINLFKSFSSINVALDL